MNLTKSMKLLSRSAAELAGVTFFVFALGWVGVRLAQIAHRSPVRAGRDGVIELRLAKADRTGEVTFIEAGYSGWFNCRGTNWIVQWFFVPRPQQTYGVELLVSVPKQALGGRLTLEIVDVSGASNHTLSGDVAGSAPGKWQTVKFGDVALPARPFQLSLKPGAATLTNLNVKAAMLRPPTGPQPRKS